MDVWSHGESNEMREKDKDLRWMCGVTEKVMR